MASDQIEKEIILRASRSRVWKALTDATQFGEWFGVKLTSDFAPSARVQGQITISGFDHLTVEIYVDRIEPEHLFSYRWHPYAIDPKVDYSSEPTTLVVFTLEDIEGGTLLKVVEAGFDQIPITRRQEAFRMNSEGWTAQTKNIERYVTESR